MKAGLEAVLLLFAASSAYGQALVVGDALITGSLGAGTTSPAARLEVLPSSATQIVFQVSGVDETPFLGIGKDGRVGLGVTPSANLDVNGTGDNADVGLELRSGNLYPGTGSHQIAFGQDNTTNRRHAIRTSHASSAANNSMDFLVWDPGVPVSSIAARNIVSLVTTSTGASVHVRPVGTPDVELEVSDDFATGGGAVHRAAEATHSARDLKSDIGDFEREKEWQAYRDVENLRHVVFRYKGVRGKDLLRDARQPLRRGLIYEDAPASIRGPGESIVIDERVTNAEMAAKELIRRLEEMQSRVSRQGQER